MDESLASKLNRLRGRLIDPAEVDSATTALPWAPRRLLLLMVTYALANAKFTLAESDDESQLGVEMRWLSPAEMLDEALNAYPGIAAASHHYLPVGTCLLGTGDPYFVQSDAPALPLYRIPHTAVTSAGELGVEQVERVSPSLETFLALARAR